VWCDVCQLGFYEHIGFLAKEYQRVRRRMIHKYKAGGKIRVS
jgi:hypothetical protein